VLMTLYLFFNEGYYSLNQDITLRKDICLEAMRLTSMLVENDQTNQPAVNALQSLMYFHASRFNARVNNKGETILYQDQDTKMWDWEMIKKGEHFLNKASQGNEISKYHLEAGIAYWHTFKTDTIEKWENILQLYNELLVVEYSPIAALNRTYVLAKVKGKRKGIEEAEKLNLTGTYLYHSLLGELYMDIDNTSAILHFQKAMDLARSKADQAVISQKIMECKKQSFL